MQRELENMKLVENTLDGLIKTCAQQLFDMTDDVDNSAYPFPPSAHVHRSPVVFNLRCTSAYITHEDVSRVAVFQEQTVIVVRASEETKLEIPTPTEVNARREHTSMDAGEGQLKVMVCFRTPSRST